MRAKQKLDYGNACIEKSKQLEMQEAQLLDRLQKTYQTERSMTEQLNKLSETSPVRIYKGKKSPAAASIMTPKTQATAHTATESADRR